MSKTATLALCIFALGLGSCRFFQKKKKEDDRFIVRDSIALDRLSTGESARLLFRTQSDGMCMLRVWPQELAVDKRPSQTKERPCQNAQARKEFVELVDGLTKDTLFTVEVLAWPVGSSVHNADRVEVLENRGLGLGKEFFVARFNVPVHSAEIHQYKSGGGAEIAEILQPFNGVNGCSKGSWSEKPSTVAKAAGLSLRTLEVEGFMTGSAETLKEDSNRMRLYYNSIQPAESLRWRLSTAKDTQEFLSPAVGRFVDLTVTEPEKMDLTTAYFTRSPYKIGAKSQAPIRIQWNATPLTRYSYILVQGGYSKDSDNFYCVFPAQQSEAAIPYEPFLSQTAGSEIELTINLVQIVLQFFPESKFLPWLISSYDWRTLRVERT